MTLAITGATGFVGQTLLDRAVTAGNGVRALIRREQEPRPGVTWVPGDLGDRPALMRLVRGAEAVIHVAGVVNTPEPEGFEQGNVVGTLNVIEAAKATGVGRLVFISSLSAREPELSTYGASKARAEKLVMASGLDWTIVRPPGIFGPRDKDIFEMFRMARWGVMPMPASAGRASYLHVDDLARLLLALVPGGEDASYRVFEPDDGRAGGWPHGEFARAIGSAMGRRPFVAHLSPALLGAAARIDQTLRGANARLTPDRASYMSHPDWVASDTAKVPTSVWQPQIETRAGLAATAQWYREAGWL